MLIKIFFLGMILAGVSHAFFGGLVFLKNRKNIIGTTFLFLSAAFAFWTFSYAIWLTRGDMASALLWSRMLNLGAIFIPAFFLHYVISVLKLNKKRKILIRSFYTLTIFFALFSFSPWFVKGVEVVGRFSFWPQAGFLYTLFLVLCFVGGFGYAMLLLIKRALKGGLSREVKLQVRFILIGSIISVVGGSSNFPLMYGASFPAILTLLTIFHPFFWSYGAVKYQIFNMKAIATELAVIILWVFILVRTFASENLQEQVINLVLFIVVLFVGVLLIRSVLKEVRLREKMEDLAQELAVANERLKVLDQKKSEFVSIASHQLRSPLTAIKGYSSMLLEGSFGDIPQKAKEAVERIYRSSERLVIIIEDFLNISRIEQGRMKYEFSSVDLGAVTQEVIETLRATAEEKKLKLSFEKIGGDEFRTTADSGKIQQVITNLVDNSIKYTPEGSISVKLQKDPHGRKILLSIKDTGIGIDPKDAAHLFQKFSRVGEGGKQNVKGTGLGLFVAKEIIKAHHGNVWADSEGLGKGSTFYIEFMAG